MSDREVISEADQVKSLLHLEEIDVDLFRGSHLYHPVGARAVYGGQVCAHSLRAAYSTVPHGQRVHSMHCYFLKGGNAEHPILYQVDRTREGRTYSNRNVKAIQDGQAIFTMQASFKKQETDPFSHQYVMPQVPGPEGLPTIKDLLLEQLGKKWIPEARKQYIQKRLAVVETSENRYFNKSEVHLEEPHPPATRHWVKALGDLGDDHVMHECVGVYLSDNILGVSLLPSALNSKGNKLRFFMASLDHTVWFHSPFRMDQWMLFEKESPICIDGRGMLLGRIWRQDGTLAMSVAQEGVVRTFQPKL